MNPQPDSFDDQLNQALSNYTPVEARPHLEQRLQAAIQTALNTKPETRFRHPLHLLWTLALPLAAVVLLIGGLATLYFSHYSGERNLASTPKPTSPTRPEPQPQTAQAISARTTSLRATSHLRKQLTQPSVPSTLKPTEQERQLFQLAALHPHTAQSILDLQANRDKPLQIHPIRVLPTHVQSLRWTAIPIQQLDLTPIEMATRQPITQSATFLRRKP